MRRTNLCAKPAETLDALAGDPSNWMDFKNGTEMSLQPGRYVASCNVTEIGSIHAAIQYWDNAHHLQLGHIDNAVIGVNVMRFDLQPDADTAAGGGGFRASSPRRPRRTELEAGDRR